MYVTIQQKFKDAFKVTCEEPESNFAGMTDTEVAEFFIKQSCGDNWHRRCTPCIDVGDRIAWADRCYQFVKKNCEDSIEIKNCNLNMK